MRAAAPRVPRLAPASLTPSHLFYSRRYAVSDLSIQIQRGFRRKMLTILLVQVRSGAAPATTARPPHAPNAPHSSDGPPPSSSSSSSPSSSTPSASA